MSLDGILDRQRMRTELPGVRVEYLLSGLVEADPCHPALLAARFVGLPQRTRLLGPPPVYVDCVVYDHGQRHSPGEN